MDIKSQAYSHDEINSRTTAGNKCYFSLVRLFKSKKLSKGTKIILYKILVGLYARGSWASTKSDKNKLIVFERKSLRRIFKPKKNDESEYEIRSNREIMTLFSDTNMVATLKSQRLK